MQAHDLIIFNKIPPGDKPLWILSHFFQTTGVRLGHLEEFLYQDKVGWLCVINAGMGSYHDDTEYYSLEIDARITSNSQRPRNTLTELNEPEILSISFNAGPYEVVIDETESLIIEAVKAICMKKAAEEIRINPQQRANIEQEFQRAKDTNRSFILKTRMIAFLSLLLNEEIKKSSFRIDEALGELQDLDRIALLAQSELSGESDTFVHTEMMNGYEVKINFNYSSSTTEYKGLDLHSFFQLLSVSENGIEVLISLGDLKLSSIVHELKHLHRVISKGLIADELYYLDHVGRDIIEKRPDLFDNTKAAEWVQLVFYYTPDEFEAVFNEYRRAIKREMPQIPLDTAARREWISEWLADQDIHVIYKEIAERGFTLSEFFKDKESYLEFLRIFIQKREEFIDESPEYDGAWASSKETLQIPVAFLKKLSKRIEWLITKNAQRGFKKFSRLLI